jgi:Zn ribbon nucleic-acid-binding protein
VNFRIPSKLKKEALQTANFLQAELYFEYKLIAAKTGWKQTQMPSIERQKCGVTDRRKADKTVETAYRQKGSNRIRSVNFLGDSRRHEWTTQY